MNTCAILGAGGHGRVVAEIVELNNFGNLVFFDDRWPKKRLTEGWSIVGGFSELLETANDYDLVCVAIGNNQVRLERHRQLEAVGAKFDFLCHPAATISSYALLGSNTVVMANAVINPFAKIGDCCIINTGATIDHDCNISEGVHISPGANLAGGVNVGAASWVGVSAIVKENVSVGSGVIVGAGSTVIKDIPENVTVVGTPATILK